ncbi:unnamed protein product [Symbiodinium natans]|uniref:Uncharacterized protein n=1 Tax=Symbiodinium natans TaxID=878477 RepID=A0A812PX30_9DINO|nr:unnamed protein product [Symbiodinium natans]
MLRNPWIVILQAMLHSRDLLRANGPVMQETESSLAQSLRNRQFPSVSCTPCSMSGCEFCMRAGCSKVVVASQLVAVRSCLQLAYKCEHDSHVQERLWQAGEFAKNTGGRLGQQTTLMDEAKLISFNLFEVCKSRSQPQHRES